MNLFLDPHRIEAERQFVQKYFNNEFFYSDFPPHGPMFFGDYKTSTTGKTYQLRLSLPYCFPNESPTLLVHYPVELPRFTASFSDQISLMLDKKLNLNDMGISHDFHINGVDKDGYLKICHTPNWEASKSCVGIILKGFVWLEVYGYYYVTGQTIDSTLTLLKEKCKAGTFLNLNKYFNRLSNSR